MKMYKYTGGRLLVGDCLQLFRRIPNESVDLVFADPPFNIGYKYDEYNDNKTPLEYLNWTIRWMKQCQRILKPNGSIYVAIGDEYAAEIKKTLDWYFTMRNWIIWFYKFGVYCTTKFGRDHAHILYYCKNPKQRTFNSDAVRIPSLRQTRYNDKRANNGGRVPGDVWRFPRVCGTHKERNTAGHKCQMPESILERIIKVSTGRGQIVLDPFAGTGTTLAVAKRLGRRFIGFELSNVYASAINARLLRNKVT